MASQSAIQFDMSSIPQGAVSLLGALTPILKALSADSVNPLAVIQLEAIGHCFPMSGPLARKTPDALTRCGSVKLARLRTSIGWMAGDTTSALSQTAGGQSAALLTMCLVEMFCRNSTGHLLFDLSMKLLPTNQCLASMAQLSDLAEIVANKLQPLAFGQHHAIQVTRIREVYFNLGIELPTSTLSSLLDRITVDSMVDLLSVVQQALREETSMAYIEGFQGLGGIVSLLMALCPDDILLLVENGIIFQGQRRSVVISVAREKTTSFSVEKILRETKSSSSQAAHFRSDDFLASPGRISSYEYLTMKTQGCLANMVDQLFSTFKLGSTRNVTASLATVVGEIMCSFTGGDFGPHSQFPEAGLLSLLGHHPHEHVRDRLAVFFGVEIAIDHLRRPLAAYKSLEESVQSLIPASECLCSQCPGSHVWATMPPGSKKVYDRCPVRSIWAGLQTIVAQAVLLSFLETDLCSLRMMQHPQTKLGAHLCHRLVHNLFPPDQETGPSTVDGPHGGDLATCYMMCDLHTDLCQLLGAVASNAGNGQTILGSSSGSTSIFPSTLETMTLEKNYPLRYRALDGQFHDGRNYYKALIEDSRITPRPLAEKSILQPGNAISPSRIGIHSDLTVSVRPYHNSMSIRTMMAFPDKVLDISFYAVHLASLSIATATPCQHDPKAPIDPYEEGTIIATGLDAPIASKGRISVVLTHDNQEAQFLAGAAGIPAAFQGASCLNCVLRDAKPKGYRLIIQS
ncbi:hypothetical protein V8C37DRAFT_414650 [Trichoderma ceciliae]